MPILYHSNFPKGLHTELHSNSLFLLYGIQHGAVRMPSNSSKIITNDRTGRNSSSEESEREGRKKEHQKITLPIFEKKKTIQEANLWWRKFIQYVKMTQDIDLTIMTNDEEILAQYRKKILT